MKDLECSLQKFANIFGRDGFDIGTIKYQEKSSIKYPVEIPFSDELLFFYEHLDLSENAIVGGDLFLQINMFSNLVGSQYGWKWVKNIDGAIVKSSIWQDAWVVIGNKSGDALIVDVSISPNVVYGSILKDRFKIANSLSRFFDVFSDWMECELVDFDMEGCDEDLNLKPDFLERLRFLAEEKLNSDEVDGFFKYFFS
ncbi:hypothetical protein [uncultured Microbulbifer sp.]|uniref:hypothetical protein n=1 Tax=uncultured Microbulbifer sp. TaxID=348147 RepID=UPI002612D617|nr:hypothetical protein [uncultured Microbulbifer sp.]